MILKWNIDTSDKFNSLCYSEIAYQLMPIFGLDDDEYAIHSDHIEATPKVFAFKWISPIRFSVYDIRLNKNSDKNAIGIRIRLYKLFIFPLLFPILGLITGFQFMPLFVGLIAYIFSLIFFGLMTFIELNIDKNRIKKKIKSLANNG